jgi:hypothetical protein
MAEVNVRDGLWTFDGDVVRIVPSRNRGVHQLRQALGDVAVPLVAVAGVVLEPGRKGGRLRLRLRSGADPLLQAARGQLPDAADPYQLTVDAGHKSGVAEYFVDELRNALLLEQVPDGPADSYLLHGPRVPLTTSAGDGTVTFDGERVRLEWSDTWAESSKKSAGPQQISLKDLSSVEWTPQTGWENGHLRFLPKGTSGRPQPKHDPYSITWGVQKLGGTALLLAAAVVARLPHPSSVSDDQPALDAGGPAATAGAEPGGTGDADRGGDPDALLRRLRELGELHREGVLTDEEFSTAKQALLRRF